MNIEQEGNNLKPHIPIPTRWEIVHYKKMNYSGKDIEEILSVPATTCNAIYRKYLDTGDVKDKDKPGRPRKASDQEEEMLVETVLAHQDMTINEALEESKLDLSKTTGWRILKEHGFTNKVASVKWEMNEDHRATRLAWAREHLTKDINFWKKVIFTDESNVQYDKRQQRYWVLKDETPEPTERDQWGPKVLVWGAISFDGKLVLEIVEGTVKGTVYLDILKRRLLKNFRTLSGNCRETTEDNRLMFQQDNAKPHIAGIVKSYFEDRDIKLLSWPPKSPDLNIIESVWSHLKSRLKASYSTREELIEDVLFISKNIPFDYIHSLYNSIPRRIQAVIDANGGPTKY